MQNNIFQDDGYCRENTLAETLLFFDKSITKEKIKTASNITNMIKLLKNYNLKIFIYMPKWYLISPKMLHLYVNNYKNICFDKKIFKNKTININLCKKAIIYFVNAIEFYNIKELWTHYFVEFFDKKRVIYDSFVNQFTANDYEVLGDFVHPKHNELLNINILKVLIWKEK